MTIFSASGNPVPVKERIFHLCLQQEVAKMVKLSHKVIKSKMAEQNWTQEGLAEAANISDRHVRNLSSRDTNANIGLCYSLSRAFGTRIEELLVIQEDEE